MTKNSTRQIILGTMDFGTAVEQARAFEVMDAFVEGGGTWLDTANCYAFWNDPRGLGGASERTIGAWLRRTPDAGSSVKIATKVRQNPLIAHEWPASAEGLSREAIRRGIADSLDRLGLDSVDLLWAHAEDRSVPLEETVDAFGELVSEGRVHRLGAANHASWRVVEGRAIAAARGIEPWTAIQLRHSLAQPRPGAALPDQGHKLLSQDDLDLATELNLETWTYTPLIRGSYAREDRPFPDAYDHPGTARLMTLLPRLAAEHDATVSQVVLAWLMDQGVSPIVGVSSPTQIREALDARALALTPENLADIEQSR